MICLSNRYSIWNIIEIEICEDEITLTYDKWPCEGHETPLQWYECWTNMSLPLVFIRR